MDSSPKTRSRRRPSRERTRKCFTLEHANRTLPLVRRIVADIVEQYKGVVAAQRTLHELADGATAEQKRRAEELSHAAVEKLRGLTEELEEVGCELKDWQTGLIDFPGQRQGRNVYLCWRLGEPAVQYWHEVDAGFNGRQPIDAES
jgi:hypothetical protein